MMEPGRGGTGLPAARILVVEDSRTQAESLKYILERQGYQVPLAANGKEALRMIGEVRPELVISDILMPEMDGLQLCRLLKSDENLAGIPVIMLTALSDPRDVLKGLECGADNFLTKPYDEEYLLARVHNALVNAEMRRGSRAGGGAEVSFNGERYLIVSERQQILDFLLSTYETAVIKNRQLEEVQERLRELNESLERQVAERTAVAEQRARQLQALALQLTEAEEGERRRIAEILHDDLQQVLASAHMQLQAVMQNLPHMSILQNVAELLEDSINKSRRLSHELSPAILYHSGLVAALRWLVGQVREQYGLEVQLDTEEAVYPIESPLKVLLFRAVRELLFNVVKHARVKSARVDLRSAGGQLAVLVSDSGRGFDTSIMDPTSGKPAGLGLLSIRERLRTTGGNLSVKSAPGAGSRFCLTVPLTAPEGDAGAGLMDRPLGPRAARAARPGRALSEPQEEHDCQNRSRRGGTIADPGKQRSVPGPQPGVAKHEADAVRRMVQREDDDHEEIHPHEGGAQEPR